MSAPARIAAHVCLGLLLGLCVGACRFVPSDEIGASLPDAGVDVPELLPAGALAEDLVMQQRVTVRWNGREESFETVVQKRGQELLLLGLGPMNSVGFRLSLVDRHVSFENRTGRTMPFVPERILADVQRVFYPWIESVERCTRCVRQALHGGVEIVEQIGAEHLEERRFTRPDRAEIVVRYEAWTHDAIAPGRAILSNGWQGYELLIETTSAQRLD